MSARKISEVSDRGLLIADLELAWSDLVLLVVANDGRDEGNQHDSH